MAAINACLSAVARDAPPSSREEAIQQARTSLTSVLEKPLKRRLDSPTIKRRRTRQQPRFRVEVPVLDESTDALASLLLELLGPAPFRSCVLLASRSDIASKIQDNPAIAQVASLEQVSELRIQAEASTVVIVAPDSSHIDAIERIVANAGNSRPIVIVNPGWSVDEEEEDDFCKSFEVAYSFTPLSIQGIFTKMEGAVLKQSTAAWRIFAKEGKDFRCISTFPRRPAAKDLEEALYNIAAANSPIVKSIKFLKTKFSNFNTKSNN